jgi:hypothetical protein
MVAVLIERVFLSITNHQLSAFLINESDEAHTTKSWLAFAD